MKIVRSEHVFHPQLETNDIICKEIRIHTHCKNCLETVGSPQLAFEPMLPLRLSHTDQSILYSEKAASYNKSHVNEMQKSEFFRRRLV